MKTTRFIVCILLVIAFFTACNSTKKIQADNSLQKPGICSQSVKYIIEKARFINSGNETKIHAEIEINPSINIISLRGDDPDKGKISFDTEIENVECTLNESLTTGQALYKGYIKRENGSKTWTTLLVEPKDGQILISGTTQDKPADVVFIVDRWEIVEH